ncbi:MAG TPA: hypothetical protein VGJ73_03385 [Verrucomicrobiae bacterium]
MSRNEINENASPLLIAGLACLLCMPAVYLATRPVVWLFSARWAPWLLAGIILIAPFMVAFTVLYRCAWHDGQPRARRLLATVVSSCIIVAIDLLLTGALALIGGMIAGTSRVMGGN